MDLSCLRVTQQEHASLITFQVLFLFATPTLYYFSTSLLLSHSSLMSLVLGHPLVLQEAELIAQRPQRLWGSM